MHKKTKIFHVRIDSKTAFSFVNEKGEKLSSHSFGKNISSDVGDIVITPSVEKIEKNIGIVIKIQIAPID